MNNAAVIGHGTVGKATITTFNIKKYYSRSDSNITLEEIAQCDFIFICLPTPVDKEGKYVTKDITEIIKKLSKFPSFKSATVIIRSTVYPGYSRYLQSTLGIRNIVSNPEFLSEDTWKEDAIKPQLVVIGGDNPEIREKVKGLYQGRFKYNEPIVTDSVTAELLKLTFNAFFVTKIVFANAIYDYAQKVQANYETLRKVLEVHPWGSKNHFRVFDKGGRGASGKCLKKDINAMAHYSKDVLFNTIFMLNESLLETSKKI